MKNDGNVCLGINVIQKLCTLHFRYRNGYFEDYQMQNFCLDVKKLLNTYTGTSFYIVNLLPFQMTL